MVSLKVPSTIVFGQDVLPQLGPVVSAIGSRALVVSESVLHEGQHIDRVLQILKRSGVETMIYDELMPGSPASRIDEIASLARASKAKAVVGLGGMRVLSIARCVANVATETKRIGDMMEGYVPTTSLPYVEVPSSYRNHLLMRDEAVIKDTRAGRARMVRLAPNTTRAAIIDTAFTQTLSSKYALAAILDTLLAAVEGFYSPQSTMYSDTLLLKATSELHKAALSGIRNPADPRFRLQAAEAGFLTAMGLAVTGQGIGGGLAYAINARFSLPQVVGGGDPAAPRGGPSHASGCGEGGACRCGPRRARRPHHRFRRRTPGCPGHPQAPYSARPAATAAGSGRDPR
jgi:alcohol dehydrogenase